MAGLYDFILIVNMKSLVVRGGGVSCEKNFSKYKQILFLFTLIIYEVLNVLMDLSRSLKYFKTKVQ